jgi:diguanylate cyclase (GGDEF)-like protein/PAS domain S-box-containing protein
MPSSLLRWLLPLFLGLAQLASAAPLRVVLDENYPPFAFRTREGKLEGYSVDAWNLWQKKTGMAVQLTGTSWVQANRMLQDREADVIDPIFRTPEREADYDFSPPYAEGSAAIYAATTVTGIHDLASLRGFEVGVQEGDACGAELRRAGVTGVRPFPNYRELLAAASSQTVKLFCLDEYPADYYLYRLGLHRSYVKAFEVYHNNLRRGVRDGDAATLNLVNSGMAQITPAEKAALQEKWLGRPIISPRYARQLGEALVVLAALVLVLAAWLASVGRAVRVRTAELEKEKAQWRTLVESSPDLVWMKNPRGAYVACNRALAQLLGMAREDIIGKTDDELFGSRAANRRRQADDVALRGGRPVTIEEQLAPQGAPHIMETIKSPVVQPDGTVLGVLGVARDVTERSRHEQTIREQAMLLGEMSAQAHIGAWEMDPATDAFTWTDEVGRIYETPLPQPFTRQDYLDLYSGEHRAQAEGALTAAIERGEPFDIELEIVTPGGKSKCVRTICRPLLKDGRVARLRGTVQDVTERRRLEESMRIANLLYQTTNEAIVVTDEANRIVGANPAFTRQTGYELGEVVGHTPPMFSTRLQNNSFNDRLWRELLANGHWQGELMDRNKDGATAARFVNMRLIRNPDGQVYRHVIQFVDITEQKQKDELIWKQTNFDAFTGLPNRRLFLDRLEQETRKAHGAGGGVAVLLLDLDRFKEINDTFGHAKGDQALAEVAVRIAACVPEGATIGRLGGDTFALIVGEFDQRPSLEKMANEVIGAISAPLRLDEREVAYVSASVGISIYPGDGTAPADLVRNAEHAMYLAKHAGRGRFEYFTPSLQQQARVKLMLTNDLRQALARHQLELYYQPIVEVASGRIRKAETLLRWLHPQQGMISPARFIPLAEEAGLIGQIGDWVLREAIASADLWRRKYGSVIELSVNISPVQFQEAGQPAWLERLVHSQLPPNSITVEITEGVLVSDTDQVKECLRTLHANGTRVSIDDFGTGFSALSYLKRFDVDYLKIDKSFVNHMAENGNDKALTEAIIDIAHRLGIEAIAEGVESVAQRDMLAGFGCDYIQGHFYSAAVPHDAFEGLLEQQMQH